MTKEIKFNGVWFYLLMDGFLAIGLSVFVFGPSDIDRAFGFGIMIVPMVFIFGLSAAKLTQTKG